jgi:hypothetical protein
MICKLPIIIGKSSFPIYTFTVSVIFGAQIIYRYIASIKGPHNDSAIRFGETRQRFAKFQKHD